MADNVLPGIIGSYPDGGMKVQSPVVQSDSVLVIGTAEDGPMNEPVQIQSLNDLTDLFGNDLGEGSLVRGVYEVWNATSVPVNVKAMRIGSGGYASLGLKEASGVIQSDLRDLPDREGSSYGGVADQTFSVSGSLDDFIDALTITSKYAGSIYNRFSISLRSGNIVELYNPVTQEYVDFKYDIYNQRNTNADVHNTSELADAINASDKLNPYITATVQELSALYEIITKGTESADSQVVPVSGGTEKDAYADDYASLQDSTTGAISTTWNTNGTLKDMTLRISYITTADDKDSDGIPDSVRAPQPDSGVPSVIKVGPVGLTYDLNIPTGGNQVALTYVYDMALASGEFLQVSGKDNIVLANYPVNRNSSQGYDGSDLTIISLDGADLTVSEYKEHNTSLYIDTAQDGEETTFTWLAPLQPQFINDAYTGHSGDASADRADVITYNGLSTTVLKVKVYETYRGVTSECVKDYTISWATGTGTITFTDDATNRPKAGTILTIDYDTVAGQLTECGTMSELESKREEDDPHLFYFVTGNTIYFAGPAPTNIKISYEYKRVFDIPGDVSVMNDVTGEIKFTNPQKMPQITRTGGARIGLNYTYLPEWITVSGAQSLSGGNAGKPTTKKELYDALTSAYENIANYDVDVIVPVGVYMDDVMNDYEPETGIRREVNAGFHTQLATLLDYLNENVGLTIGVMGVKPATNNTLSEVNNWVTKLTVANTSDPNRAANYMPFFGSKWMSIVAADVIVSPKIIGLPSNISEYITNAATLYAGLITSLQPQDATTYKYIGRSLVANRFRLSRKQLNDIVTSRYVTIHNEDGVGLVVTKDVTTAPVGSDYDKLSTVRIVKLVSDIIRSTARPYLGTPNTYYRINSLTTEINSALQRLTRPDNQAIQAFKFEMASSPTEQREGIVRCEVDIVPVFCFEQIHVTVALRNLL